MAKQRRTSRREFLIGVSAREAALDGLHEPPDPPPRAPHLLEFTQRAMACDFTVFLRPDESRTAAEPALEALALVSELESQLSVFQAESELSRVNREAAGQGVSVEARLFALLQLALRLNQETGGCFDIAASPLWKLWGFHRRQGQAPTDAEIEEVMRRVGSSHVILDESQRRISFDQAGVELNLGAIGKGYALDRAAEILDGKQVRNYLMHGGGSSIFARGHRANDLDGWSIALRHPLRPDVLLAELFLRDEALATSGSAKQFFYYQGRRFGHVLDPRSGRPAEGVLSATVVAPQAANADALATAFFAMGCDEAVRFCERREEIRAVFVLPGKRAGACELFAIGFADDHWRVADP